MCPINRRRGPFTVPGSRHDKRELAVEFPMLFRQEGSDDLAGKGLDGISHAHPGLDGLFAWMKR